MDFVCLVSVLNPAISNDLFLVPTFEGTSPVWDIGPRSKVFMHVEQSVRYPLNGSEGDSQWSALVPGDGIVHVGPDRTPFMPSLFHQLRCLDIIRRAYIGSGEEDLTAVSRHCLNYLRQMVLCRGDLRLEPVVDPFSKHAVQPWGKHTCDDWTAVYSAYEKNEEEYSRWQLTRLVNPLDICSSLLIDLGSLKSA